MEHARLLLLSGRVGRTTRDGAVIAVARGSRASTAAAASHADGRRAVREDRRQFAVSAAASTAAAGLAEAGPRVLHHLVVVHVGRHAAGPVERPSEHLGRRVRVHLTHDLRVLVPGHAVRQLLVLLAHRFVCENDRTFIVCKMKIEKT